ncbi:DUF262 domain-containing protein [Verrucomicrobiaceae bacterium N1E253]|uniref:DUF262 domain-containing protein n=1 Tax=Oceaniferula marina TaxID=2748318 RepID=A0A851GEP8_9BACT|nr:DUF262 domain-containing protein [Oceaniferula marina]NWK55659.1 DUF262 domain-containing protein [Oceaniferula marina]
MNLKKTKQFEEVDIGVEREVIDGEDTITDPFDPTAIRVDKSTPTIDLLMRRIDRGEINLAPDFQRKGGIWNNGAQSRLIESILIRIPLPAFYVDATDEDEWLVVDGLQRLTTLRRFVIDGHLTLEGLEFLKHLEGKKFEQIPRNLQRRIEETEVTVFQIQPGTPEEVKFNIFKRINTGGLPLSAQEIRNAINGERVRNFILRLANSDEFKTATQHALSDKRMADRECVVRFAAFYLIDPNEYQGSDFDGFLNKIMGGLNDPEISTDTDLKVIEERFMSAMGAAHHIFGRFAFRKYFGKNYRRSPINKALFEVVSTNLAKLNDDQIKVLENRKEKVMREIQSLHYNDEFLSAISQGTGSPAKIRTRFGMMKEVFKRVIANDN